MKILALILALLSVPAFAADYTPWSGRGGEAVAGNQVAQGEQRCCVGNGCQGQFQCCCPAPHKPTCVNAVITPLANGNSSCKPQSCGSCQ